MEIAEQAHGFTIFNISIICCYHSSCKEGIWLKAILEEINFAEGKPIEIYCDNQSCIKLASNPRISDNICHISMKHHFLRDMIEEKNINIKFTPTTLMWVDFLTKAVTSHKH